MPARGASDRCGVLGHGLTASHHLMAHAWALLRGAPLAERVTVASAAAAVLAGLPAGSRRVATQAAIADVART